MTLLIGEKVTAEKNRRFERTRRLDLWNAWNLARRGNDWIDHCCFRRSRDTREDYSLAQESLAPTNGVQRSHLREEHSALLHLPLVRSMESSRSRWRVCPAPVV